ncbi:MAG: TonB-dependent receptor [Candidatus Omnitrophica bacterium]|nr:TonB-dependent receptor [Candidatus Omnitrophota bacterium]
MKCLFTFAVFFLISSSLIYGQNIEIPETVVTGSDRNIYKTPVFFYPHQFQINFPHTPGIPEQYLKKPTSTKNEKVADVGTKNFKELTVCAGKFGYISSDILLNYPGWHLNLSALHDNSYRRRDGKNIIEAHIQKSFAENIDFAFDLWNCIKEVSPPGGFLTYKKKHTVTTDTKLILKQQDYRITFAGTKNSLGELEQTGVFFILNNKIGKFDFNAELGFNEFADEKNRIVDLSGQYRNENLAVAITIKNIGDEIRVLPSANFQVEKDGTKFQAGFSSTFSFPDLWKIAGEQPHLDMKNVFLPPEEIYSIYAGFYGKITGVDFSIEGQISYEKLGYHWLDIDNDNLYEPSVLKDNFTNMTGFTLSKKFEKFYIESGHFRFNQNKKKSGFPESTSYFKAGFVEGKLSSDFQLIYEGNQIFDSEKVKGYTIFSTAISYNVTPDLKLFFRFNNILGNDYEIAPGYPGRPFDFIAGFQARW